MTLDVPLNVNAREGVVFVLRTTSNKWIKNGSEDFFASLDGFTLERPKHQTREHKHKEEEHRKHDEQRKVEPVAPQVQQKPKVKVTAIKRERWDVDDIALDQGIFQNLGGYVAQDMVDKICSAESGATRSLMHPPNVLKKYLSPDAKVGELA